MAVYVYDNETDNYVKQNSYPIGNYVINQTLSSCIGGGSITGYNNTNGTVNFNIMGGDTCSVYFDEYKAPTLISFTLVNSIYYAEEGMTWEQWVNSGYNIGIDTGTSIIYARIYNGFAVFDTDHFIVEGGTHNKVEANDIIIEAFSYGTWYDD